MNRLKNGTIVDSRRYATGGQRVAVLKRDNGRCVYCGIELTQKTMVVDHVYPWKKGGRTVMSNLVACCAICNRDKGNQTDWKPQNRAHINWAKVVRHCSHKQSPYCLKLKCLYSTKVATDGPISKAQRGEIQRIINRQQAKVSAAPKP